MTAPFIFIFIFILCIVHWCCGRKKGLSSLQSTQIETVSVTKLARELTAPNPPQSIINQFPDGACVRQQSNNHNTIQIATLLFSLLVLPSPLTDPHIHFPPSPRRPADAVLYFLFLIKCQWQVHYIHFCICFLLSGPTPLPTRRTYKQTPHHRRSSP